MTTGMANPTCHHNDFIKDFDTVIIDGYSSPLDVMIVMNDY